jgi:5-methylcytosine-specific restriction endonuclease McrA
MDNHECQICKRKGRYRRADIVHHVKHLKDRPDLALSIWDGEERQLVSVCRQCHEDLHPERTVRYRYGRKKRVFGILARSGCTCDNSEKLKIRA